MKKWIETDTYKLSQIEGDGQKQAKQQITFLLSPYDVPDAVRATIDEETQRIVIEFRYIPIREKTVKKRNNGVEFELGAKTKRIYKIFLEHGTETELVIETHDNQFKEHSIEVAEDALEEFIAHHERISERKEKYTAAKSALHNYKQELACEL